MITAREFVHRSTDRIKVLMLCIQTKSKKWCYHKSKSTVPAIKFFPAFISWSLGALKRHSGRDTNELREISILSNWDSSLTSAGRLEIRFLDTSKPISENWCEKRKFWNTFTETNGHQHLQWKFHAIVHLYEYTHFCEMKILGKKSDSYIGNRRK